MKELEEAAGCTSGGAHSRQAAIGKASLALEKQKLPKLTKQTVGEWFTKGSAPENFERLWTLVKVMLVWSKEQPTEARRRVWRKLWDEARKSTAVGQANTPLIAAYLTAARKAARRHPYPGIPGDTDLPVLADVYVRQQTYLNEAGGQRVRGLNDTVPARSHIGPALPAEEVFQADSSVCLLVAGPGAGKSTLLRAHLAESASRWLDNVPGKTVSVMVRADSLATTDLLPAAVAKAATCELKQFALLEELTADLFLRFPRAGASWLVLIDGLDEIPSSDDRHAILQMVTDIAAAEPRLYRFVIATRPLPARELQGLGMHVPCFELQPFSPNDLRTYATKWFHGLNNPCRHAEVFINRLKRSRLDVLARTPLMATMLCQLYAADPVRPLPDGRTGAYQEFVQLIYEQNVHKNIKSTHDAAIRRLKDRHQIPIDNQNAEQAAQQVRDHLLELIDYLAYERINGNTAPAIEVLASHLHVSRPVKVNQILWNDFLGDLLRPTGLLAQRADDFDFLHQTLLEYHAARHVTRSQQARTDLLYYLFTRARQSDSNRWYPPDLDPSYLGFLLDKLTAPSDQITSQAVQLLEEVTAYPSSAVCSFLTTQVELGTCFPPGPITSRLIRFAEDATLHGSNRVEAARALARMEGYLDVAARQFRLFAQDTTFGVRHRVEAALALAGMDAYRDDSAGFLIAFAEDLDLHGSDRVAAARALADVEGYRDDGAARLIAFTEDTTLNGDRRVEAARALADVEGYRDDGAARLIAFTEDTTLHSSHRVAAARALAGVDGYRDDSAAQQARLRIEDATLHGSDRVEAARALADVEGYRDDGAARLIAFTEDTTLHSSDRVEAARALADVEGYRDDGAARLIAFTKDSYDRMRAAEALADVEGYRDEAANQFHLMTQDTNSSNPHGVTAAIELVRMGVYQEDAVPWLIAAAEGTARVVSPLRVVAALALAGLKGHRREGAEHLRTLAEDAALGDDRLAAARALAGLEGYQDVGASKLRLLAQDATLWGHRRVVAALALAGLEGHRREGAEHLRTFAEDAALGSQRVAAARALAGLEGYQDVGASKLRLLAQDATLWGHRRVVAALALAGLEGHRREGAEHLRTLAEDASLPLVPREEAVRALASIDKDQDGGAAYLVAYDGPPPQSQDRFLEDHYNGDHYDSLFREMLARLTARQSGDDIPD
ncbi:hypothetical protein OG607_41715 [Streptomyces sp. NBC_01537]|uniref:NACHT domain-containing protein n=1 Tax=Streptomyces sp. NBC_01537 TaxID=2903896 RepID=UPI003868468D